MLPFPVKKEIIIFAAYAKEDKEPVKKFKLVLKMLSELEKVSCFRWEKASIIVIILAFLIPHLSFCNAIIDHTNRKAGDQKILK
jgi:hypothetical protein